MRWTPLFVALVLLAPAPTVSAWGLGLRVPPLHVGDKLLYASHVDESIVRKGEDVTEREHSLPWLGDIDTLVTVAGRSTGEDEFGVAHPTVEFQIARARDDKIVSTERCEWEPAMGWAIEKEYLAGGPSRQDVWNFTGSGPVTGSQSRIYNQTPLKEFRTSACDGAWQSPGLFGPSLQNGETLRDPRDIRWTFSLLPFMIWAHGSQPAVSTTWRGHDALTYSFPLAVVIGPLDAISSPPNVTGVLDLTLASGFPGVVMAHMHQVEERDDEVSTADSKVELVGYEAGSEPLPNDIPWRDAPNVNPTITRADPAALEIDDRAFGLAYPASSAFQNLRNDPQLGFDRWLAAHPSARIEEAHYESAMAYDGPAPVLGAIPREPVRGPGWTFRVGDESATIEVVSQLGDPRVRLAALNHERGEWAHGIDAPRETQLASSDDAVRLLAHAGLTAGEIRELRISPRSGFVLATDVPWASTEEAIGKIVTIDIARGSIARVDAASVRVTTNGGLLSSLSPPTDLTPATTNFAGSLLRIRTIAEAATALTLLGIAALVLRALVPLYSRLRRERILEDPTRARMLDLIREDPGIHMAAIERALGIAKGATGHHLAQLKRHGLVFVVEESGHARCYARGSVPPDVARRSALLRAGSNARIYDHLAAHPDASLRETARALGISAPSVHRAKKRLEKAGLLPSARMPESESPKASP